jgi:hypothetical protein
MGLAMPDVCGMICQGFSLRRNSWGGKASLKDRAKQVM